jgi:hypothetical protein
MSGPFLLWLLNRHGPFYRQPPSLFPNWPNVSHGVRPADTSQGAWQIHVHRYEHANQGMTGSPLC